MRPATSHFLMYLFALSACGCTINRARIATEQLVAADAVDRVVAQIDFSPLSCQKVFFDTKYLAGAKLNNSPNIDYLTSSLRQQMLAYDCRLTDKMDEADVVVEARVGALGNDSNDVTYGIPGAAAVSTAAAFATGMPAVGPLPELSLGRRHHQWGAAKVGLFAYDRISHQRVWQAGGSTGASQARELWVMGFGPFQGGRVYKEAHASMNNRSRVAKDVKSLEKLDPLEAYSATIDFSRESQTLLSPPSPDSRVNTPGNPPPSQVLPASQIVPE